MRGGWPSARGGGRAGGTANAKLLSWQQVFSHTQSTFNPEQYCQMAPHYDFTWFEMQHSRLRFDEVEKMMHACPGVGATPMIRWTAANRRSQR